jgi:signal transduction histidine kinase
MDDDCKTRTQLIDDLALLRQQLTVKSEFLTIMSYELRTPLTVILGYTDMMIKGAFGAVTAEGCDILGRIHKNANALCEFMTAMLDLSRLEAGRLPVDEHEVTIPSLLKELADETQELREKTVLERTTSHKIPSRLPLDNRGDWSCGGSISSGHRVGTRSDAHDLLRSFDAPSKYAPLGPLRRNC